MNPLLKITTLAATTAILAGSLANPANAQDGGFHECLQTIKADAMRQGVPANIADRAFQGLTPDQKVIDLDQRQPEFSLTYAKYVGGTVTADRIVKGQQRIEQGAMRCRPSTVSHRNTSWRSGASRRTTAPSWATSASYVPSRHWPA